MFYQVSQTKYINLDNVSYVVFNSNQATILFAYSIKLKHVVDSENNARTISDYFYYKKTDDFYNFKQACLNAGFKQITTDTQDLMINPAHVSTIKVREDKIAVNFSTPVSFTDKEGNSEQLTAQFVYIDICDNVENIINALIN